MISNFKQFLNYIESDGRSLGLTHHYKAFFLKPVFRFTVLLRFNEYLLNTKRLMIFRIIPMIWFKRLSIRLSFSIPFNVFGPGLAIVHYGLVVVNPSAIIGKNCRIHAGVNIGASAGFKDNSGIQRYAPKIGDSCYLGPGAKLFGPITIGDNCVIGANAVINKSFKENGITIAGVPGKKVSDKSSEGMVINGS
jgi:serine O-acetyltransferase